MGAPADRPRPRPGASAGGRWPQPGRTTRRRPARPAASPPRRAGHDDVVLPGARPATGSAIVGEPRAQVEAGERLAGQGVGLLVGVRQRQQQAVAGAGSRSRKPAANHARPSPVDHHRRAGRRTSAARSGHIAGSPIRAAEAMQRRAPTRPGSSASCRATAPPSETPAYDAGRPRRELVGPAPDHCGELGDRERLRRRRAAAVAGQVPADHLEPVGEPAGARRPRAASTEVPREGPDDQQRQARRRCRPAGREPRSAMAGPPRACAGEDRVDERVGAAEVVARGSPLPRPRSASRSSAAASARGHRVGVDLEPGDQLGGLGRGRDAPAPAAGAAPATRRARRRRAARRRPERRRGAAARASCGACSAAARTSTASTGLRLCGIVDEPPRPAPAPRGPRRSRAGQQQHVGGDATPSASVQATRASPIRVTGARLVCHGSAGQRRPSSSANAGATAARSASGARSASQRQGPGGAAALDRQPVEHASSWSRGVQDAGQPLRGLEAERVGTAYWVSVRPAIDGAAVRRRPARPARAAVAVRSSRSRCSASRASSTSAVSSTSWLVSPRCTIGGVGRRRRRRAAARPAGRPGCRPPRRRRPARRGRPARPSAAGSTASTSPVVDRPAAASARATRPRPAASPRPARRRRPGSPARCAPGQRAGRSSGHRAAGRRGRRSPARPAGGCRTAGAVGSRAASVSSPLRAGRAAVSERAPRRRRAGRPG